MNVLNVIYPTLSEVHQAVFGWPFIQLQSTLEVVMAQALSTILVLSCPIPFTDPASIPSRIINRRHSADYDPSLAEGLCDRVLEPILETVGS